jgi:hypothetical protein
MGVVSNSSDIPMQRCPHLVIKADTPKGTVSMPTMTANIHAVDEWNVQAEASFLPRSYLQKP